MTNQFDDDTHTQRVRIAWLLAVMLLAPLGMGARGCGEGAVIGADCNDAGRDSPACACERNGKYFAGGKTFPAGDGCNVCACVKDGSTHCTDNTCDSSDAGSGNGGQGGLVGPGRTCGGLTGASCSEDEYCAFEPDAKCGAADARGTCNERPEVCDAIYTPVCGCDDKTYSSECTAAIHGISVARQGECGTSSGDAGTGAGCQYNGEHHADGEGFPAADGCNTCKCAAGGVACTEIGCSGGGKTCGGLLGAGCGSGEYCNFPPDAACGAADATGTCEKQPAACTKEYKPVCGCDGQTYGNACTAASSGVSVAEQGACEDAGTGGGTGKNCGGIAGLTCDGEQYCDFAMATQCGSGDQFGTCRDRPDICDAVLAEVCGCDGHTYSNDCYAAIAGVSVASFGACDAP